MTTMHLIDTAPFTVLGFAERMDDARSAHLIPALWAKVHGEGLLAQIPGRVNENVYAVYSQLEDAGRSRNGWFTFLIGVRVAASTPVADGLQLVSVPASARARFDIPDADPARVLEAWDAAWNLDDRAKSFLCEYEEYGPAGASVNIGVSAAPATTDSGV